MASALGVDGCRLGWVGIELRDGRFAAAHMHPTLAGLVALAPDARAVGIDIPLGLMDREVRVCDRAAKRALGSRASSLFVMPPRPVFEAADHAAASRLSRTLTGVGISIQTWNLRVKIAEAEQVLAGSSPPMYEVHPELSFQQMGLQAGDGRKKSWRGQRARLRILAEHGIELPEDLGPAVARVPADDVLDAAAAAWSAHRIDAGAAFSLPDPPQPNARGQRLAIWC